ncbi:lipoprotein [Shimwellia blattae]|uniref:Putative lipoprotein n=1 Tax=Shimwellia blattae (strain ATCC 29907 / DSM 4481 / JCM 1650 / NBRC 105725 / CDC 9005-74) TaxID=630626 RepID=I2BAS7_SHIBC|nr:lipoprotein [Shimwellia blattae]AFJ47631.1 putative lipoprotein [Shimwellia blattae DSM 4481 = NBRC 105725]GAB79791.1 hypothetical protein YbjP [Shimwellia blattae DSM 4481 = NBRC 105725]VDY65131.1 Uncharacterized lipoprotein ybjP precursor [Shimwellia blattae]VEC23676.1 Uncharacterized lipoprotein ybjP precursor [Shimwellia blattae]
MRCSTLAWLTPCALLLSACTTTDPADLTPLRTAVTPVYKDIGTRTGPCISGGPDNVAQQFYDYRIAHPGTGLNNLAGLRPYLSSGLWNELEQASQAQANDQVLAGKDLFASNSNGIEKATVSSASSIPNTDARNIPLRVNLNKGTTHWQDEVLMVREGQCWTVDDIRYLGATQMPAGNLRLSLERR